MPNPIIREDLEYIFNSGLNWEEFRGKTVLISGANGFVASYIAEALLYLNEKLKLSVKVIALVRNAEKAKARFSDYSRRHDLKFVIQDVCKPLDVKDKVDYIIHAASQASPKYYGIDPVGTLSANVQGTINLLEYARKHEVQSFLYFSSAEIYGRVEEENNPVKEYFYGYLDPLMVRSCYAESKRMGENICISWAHQYDMNVRIVRPFHTYGPMMALDDGRVFADFTADIVNNRDIVMTSDGASSRAYCYLADAVVAYLMVMLRGKRCEAYNVGNPDEESDVLNLANTLVKLFPGKNLKVVMQENRNNNYLVSKVNRIVPDIEKMRNLGWEPKFSIEEGFKRTVNSYLAVEAVR